MEELSWILRHPSKWETLTAHQRLLLAGLVLLSTLVTASLAGVVAGRLSRHLHNGPESTSRLARVRRGFVWLFGLVGAYLATLVAPLPPRVEGALSSALFILGSLVAARLTIVTSTAVLGRAVAHASEHERIEREYLPLAAKLLTIGVGLIWIIVVLRHLGQDVSSLVAALGVGSLAIGLAAQQTLGNMFSGFTLLVDRPFRPGDRVRLATGEVGDVMEIGVRSTRILLGDRNLLVVPNTELANSRVLNFSSPRSSVRSEVRVTVVYGTDVDRALAILRAAAQDDPHVLAEGECATRVAGLSERGVELVVGFDVRSYRDAAGVEDQVRRRLLTRFAAEKILFAPGAALRA